MSISPSPTLIDEAFIRALPDPLYVVDRDFIVRQANPRAAELGTQLGLENELPGEVRTLVREAMGHDQHLGKDDFRRPVTLSNGETYLTRIFRLAGGFGAQEGWAVLLVNVTRLAENVEVKVKTLRALSHEVKTPLTSIRLSLHLLLEGKLGTLNPDQRELLEVGCEECERMLATVQSQIDRAQNTVEI